MIIDTLENVKKYFKNQNLANAIQNFLADAENKQVGKHDIYGGTFAKVQEYTTKLIENVKMEAHVKYLDLQYIHSGKEIVITKQKGDDKPVVEYNEIKDVEFYLPTNFESNKLNQGCFALIFPEDLHQCIADGQPINIKKVVVKIPVGDI